MKKKNSNTNKKTYRVVFELRSYVDCVVDACSAAEARKLALEEFQNGEYNDREDEIEAIKVYDNDSLL